MLQKQSITINFSGGIDTINDQNQLPMGRFESLQNSVFVKADGGGALNKRNGFPQIASLPDNSSKILTSYNDNLYAIGQRIYSYSQSSNTWANKGGFTPVQLSTLSLIRNPYSQVYADVAVAKGLACCVYNEVSSSYAMTFKYSVFDSVTGESFIQPTTFAGTNGSVSISPKVYNIGDYFMMLFDSTTGSTSFLQYQTVNVNTPTLVSSITTLSSNYQPSLGTQQSFEGAKDDSGTLYFLWNSAGRNGIKAVTISSALSISSLFNVSSATASLVSVSLDTTGSVSVWAAWLGQGVGSGRLASANFQAFTTSFVPLFGLKSLSTALSAATVNASGSVTMTSTARSGIFNVFQSSIGLPSNIQSAPTGTMGASLAQFSYSITTNSISGVAGGGSYSLASKAVSVNSQTYFLAAWQSAYQSTYFLFNAGSTTGIIVPPLGGIDFEQRPYNPVARLAYGNGGGFPQFGLPSFNLNSDSTVTVGYLFKDLITPVNKQTNISSTIQTTGIYTQTGVNTATFDFSGNNIVATELGQDLNLNGGFLWSYDGLSAVEQNFLLYPDYVKATTIGTTGGFMLAQSYFYSATYEWTDSKGNIFRSSPSVPINYTVSSSNVVTQVQVNALTITNRSVTAANVVLYRWSTNQPIYYKVASIPVLSLGTAVAQDVTFNDTLSDANILGNQILYTNGGVVENAACPACTATTIFDSRFWAISAEDPNLLLYSKQVIETVPVEMSDLFTYFVPPSTSARSSTGPMKCIAPMDDKLIIFKKNTIFYINGTGPDNTGASNNYSPAPIFITAAVGCSNQSSITLIPQGLMFQSDKGWWLLGRDLSVSFIGKEIEAYNTATTLSASSIPGTNEVRFTINSSNQMLVYDYFAGQWDQYAGVSAISGTVCNNKHSLLFASGSVSQELVGSYVDSGVPVTMGFKTGWINLAGLQGYVRAYRMYLLGKFYTPHTYTVGIAYDYNPQVVQTALINPTNTVGSGSIVEQWQINFDQQQCQSFQLTFNEISSSTAGVGLSLSGIKIVSGVKHDFPKNVPTINKTS